MLELLGHLLGGILTLLVLSYLVEDGPVYRLALHVLVGVLIGYTIGVVTFEVILKMALPALTAGAVLVVPPLALGILLLLKAFPKQAYLANASVAYLVGTGTAVALGGALLGTLIPQIRAAGASLGGVSELSLLDGAMILIGTIATLLFFTFSGSSPSADFPIIQQVLGIVRGIGRVFLTVAFGLAFSAAITASLSVFIGRTQYMIDLVLRVAGR